MLSAGTGIYVRFEHESSERLLHSATIVRMEENGACNVQLREPALAIPADDPVQIYYHCDGEFVRQRMQPTSHAGIPHSTLALRPSGSKERVEHRQSYRVPSVQADLRATIGHEADCPVLDISDSGFSFASRRTYESNNVLPTTVLCGGRPYFGLIRIQTRRRLPDGHIRYGALCVDDASLNTSLREGLSRLTLMLQRQHLESGHDERDDNPLIFRIPA